MLVVKTYILGINKYYLLVYVPITVAARCKACIVFAGSNTGIVSSNQTQGMDVCLRLFCLRR
jgi:hypothetical protein